MPYRLGSAPSSWAAAVRVLRAKLEQKRCVRNWSTRSESVKAWHQPSLKSSHVQHLCTRAIKSADCQNALLTSSLKNTALSRSTAHLDTDCSLSGVPPQASLQLLLQHTFASSGCSFSAADSIHLGTACARCKIKSPRQAVCSTTENLHACARGCIDGLTAGWKGKTRTILHFIS